MLTFQGSRGYQKSNPHSQKFETEVVDEIKEIFLRSYLQKEKTYDSHHILLSSREF